ncbi:MAG: hypothetical protein GY811_27980 [Myxococcales bacterium]|nr:hypothetical protein [Myxococcales bacterium]
MGRWYALYVVLPVLGGLLACAAAVVRNAPAARRLLNLLLPYKAMVGVALLGGFFVNWQEMRFNPLKGFDLSFLFGAMVLTNLGSQLVLGFTMGFGQLAKWIPGESEPEERAEALQRKLMPYEVSIGVVAMTSGLLGLLFALDQELFF